MDSLDYSKDDFSDIIAKDARFNPRAYTLLMDVIDWLFEKRERINASDILEEFRDRTLDLFGPMSYTVLREWGLSDTSDVGEMVCNLVDSRRIGRNESCGPDAFAGAYDFEEAFLEPYR